MAKKCSEHPIAKWALPFFVFLLIGCLYGIFLYVNILPQLQLIESPAIRFHQLSLQTIDKNDPHLHKGSVAEVLGVTIAFHILFFLFMISFLRSMITHPGSLPNSAKWSDGKFPIHVEDEKRLRYLVRQGNPDLTNPYILRFLRLLPLVERKKDKSSGPEKLGDKRSCKYCERYKPDRCHHCSVCNSCVLRMDHHCPWLANCIGYHNYKFFLLLVFYALCSLAFMFIAMFPRLLNVFQPIMDISYFLRKDMVVVVGCAVSAFLFIALFVFFGFHIWLVFKAMTTIEFREKSHFKKTFLVSHIKFDYGSYSNFVHIFGPPWMWLLPITPPHDNFLTLQHNFLRIQPDSKDEAIEKQRQRLLEHLCSVTTKENFIREAGSYFTPPPDEDFQLWKLSSPKLRDIPDEKPIRPRVGVGVGLRRNPNLRSSQEIETDFMKEKGKSQGSNLTTNSSQGTISDEEAAEEEEEREVLLPEEFPEGPIDEDEPVTKPVEVLAS